MKPDISPLFESYLLGSISLKNRFVLAPMTRSRSSQPGDVPNALMATYYGQRSSAGLLITEATQVSLQGKGYARTPGIYTPEQVEGWKQVTQTVHELKSRIFLQLWHVGRVSSSKVNGLQPLAPSPLLARSTNVYIFDGKPNGDATFVPTETPRGMSQEEISQTIEDFTAGAKNAIAAGFDGVEVHGGNGYLIDQFLRSNSNQRTDEYGGSPAKRIRFLIETVQSIVRAVGKDRVGVRLAPFIQFKDMEDPEILDTIILAAEALHEQGIAYIHLSEADWSDSPVIPLSFRERLRKIFSKTIIVAGQKTPEEGAELIRLGLVDLIGFGRKYLANPDYPERVREGAPLNEIKEPHTLFGGGSARGYTDYPTLAEAVKQH